jgi:quercetin dioxygenase-like cupin family protein
VAQRGDEFVNQAGGQRLIMRRVAAETGGQLLEMEAVYAPGGQPPPVHAHPHQEERFTALAGLMRVRVAGHERQLAAGDTLVIPAGTPHTMWNDGSEEVRLRWEVRPALRSEDFFEELYGLAGTGRPPLLRLGALFRAYRDEFRLTSPAQRLLFGVLGSFGRRKRATSPHRAGTAKAAR